MSKKPTIPVATALMLATMLALCGVAQAKPITNTKADTRCLVEAVRTVEQPGFRPSHYTFIGGTEGVDDFGPHATDGPDVFCGFGGNDGMFILDDGDIFLGGAGNDFVDFNRGTFYGGTGDDVVQTENSGTFYGGEGGDAIRFNNTGTFYGGAGNDVIGRDNQGTFYGGAGDDLVDNRNTGTFYGEEGNDRVFINDGTFVQ